MKKNSLKKVSVKKSKEKFENSSEKPQKASKKGFEESSGGESGNYPKMNTAVFAERPVILTLKKGDGIERNIFFAC